MVKKKFHRKMNESGSFNKIRSDMKMPHKRASSGQKQLSEMNSGRMD